MERFKKLLRGAIATMLAVGLLAGGVNGTANAADNNTYDLWFGDSQMYGYGIKGDTVRSEKRFSKLVSEADNATEVNVAVSGAHWTGDNNRFGVQIDKLISQYSGKNVRRIIGQGVHNDCSNITANSTDVQIRNVAQQITGTVEPYYAKLRQSFPNAQLVYIPQVTVWGNVQKNNSFFTAVLKMGAYLADDLRQQGWTVMDMQTDLDLIGDHQDYLADSIHVNEKGHAAAAQGIIAWLNTTSVPVSTDTPAATAKATFDPNSGTGSISPVTFTPGQTITVPSGTGLSRDGWTFTGWNTKADGTGTKVKAGQSLPTQTTTGDFVLYAQWTQNSGDKTTTANGNVAKTVTPTGNSNEYRIDMSVTGSGSSENARTPTDYIVMIDESTSMSWTDSNGVKRSDYARDALKKLVSGILTTQNEKRPESKRDRVAVIHSNDSNPGYSPLSTGVAFHDKASDFDSLTVSEMGDTPWAMWLAGMRVQLGKARADAQKVGLFITDGSPSSKWYSGRAWENADGEYDVKSTLTENQNQSEYSRSLMQSKTMGKDGWDAFYNIGIDIASQKCDGTISSGTTEDMKIVCLTPKGDDFPKSEYDKYGSNSGYYNYLYWLKTGKVASNGTVAAKLDRSDFDSPLEGLTRKMAGAGVNAHISTPSGSGLSDAISSAMKDVTLRKTMRNATLTDPLSKWVEPVGLADGKADGITVTKDGKTMTSGYTASYDAKTRTVTVGIPGDLADGSVYKASFKVRLNGTALSDHQTNAYPDTGDPGTGNTSAGKKGYASNGNATASWTNVSSKDGKETLTDGGSSLPKPVVQVTSHTVTFDTNGGNAIASQTVDDKGKAKEPTAPTRDSWTFAGWYLNGVKYDFTTPVTQDITLKAGWKRVAPSMEFKDIHKRISAGSKSGQQKLTLDVKGTGETNKSVTPSDVVILVDETNSMRECADGSSKAGSGIQCSTGPSKRDNLGNIIDSAVTSILAANTGRSADQQSRISVIRFAGRNSKYPPKALSQFTTDKNFALPNGWNQGDDLYQTGTDWATALEHVGDAGNTRSNVNKQIILVTDGLATAANEDYTKAGTTANAALNIKDSATLQKVIKAYGYANQRTMTVTQSLAKAGWHLRVVGVSADASATALGDSYLAGTYPYVGKDGSIGLYKKGSQPSGYLSQIEWIASVANNAGDGTAIGSDFEATDINDITSTLTSTVITSTTMRNTVISDPLSEWVAPVGLVDGKGTGITVSKDGKPMDSGYTAVYDGSSRTVKVSLPDSLADGSVYSVSFEVVLSDKARSNYMQSGTYPDTGDADTGTTSAGKKGYFTNGNAMLSWDAVTSTNGTPLIVSHKAKYAKPVASYDSSNVPPVLTNKLPGTGGIASLIPVFIGAGLALALAAVWIVRKRLTLLP